MGAWKSLSKDMQNIVLAISVGTGLVLFGWAIGPNATLVLFAVSLVSFLSWMIFDEFRR